MPVYTFRFSSRFIGQEAQVFDASTGEEVAGSPFTIEADGTSAVVTATLDGGNYSANALEGLLAVGGSQTTGILDVAASLESSGGGVVLDGEEYSVELSAGQTFDAESGAVLEFDTASDGLTLGEGGATVTGFTPGLYLVMVNLDFTQPAENRFARVAVNSYQLDGVINATGTAAAASLYGQLLLVIGEPGLAGGITLSTTVLDDEPSPADLVMSYGYVQFNRIG